MKHRCRIDPGTVCTLLFTVMLAAGPDSPALEEVAALTESESPDRALAVMDRPPPASDMRAKVAWTLLASGSDTAALRQFARLAGRHPYALMPKIGYSLSAAGMGDLSNAARAMRRVLRVDPEALREVELEHRLRLRLETMRTAYLRRLARFDHDWDGAIMLASMCYLLREDETARHAIRYLKAARAHGPETRNMERLVLELTQPVVDEVVQADEPEVDEPLDFTLVVGQMAPTVDETAASLQPVDSTPVIEPQRTMSQEPDVLDEPMDFTLVFDSVEPPLEETLITPAMTGSAPPATVVATATPQADPWAPAEARTINDAATGHPAGTVPHQKATRAPATAPAAASDTATRPVELPETPKPQRVQIDYDKLRENLSAVGGALDSFTEKLIRIITAARHEAGSSAP